MNREQRRRLDKAERRHQSALLPAKPRETPIKTTVGYTKDTQKVVITWTQKIDNLSFVPGAARGFAQDVLAAADLAEGKSQ